MHFRPFWAAFSTLVTVVTLAWLLAYASAKFFAKDGPVIITSKFVLNTPTVDVGGTLSFTVWRESTESCPGEVKMDFARIGGARGEVVSARYELLTPGYNSPPPLTIKRPMPKDVSKGRWLVNVYVESECPTRTRRDPTALFELEVVDAESNR